MAKTFGSLVGEKFHDAYGFVLDFFSSVEMVAFGIAVALLSIFLVCPSLAAGMVSWGIVLS